MKKLLSVLFFLYSLTGVSQFDDSVDSLALKHHILEYKVTNLKSVNGDTSLANRMMELRRFNENGRPVYEYTFNVDVIYTIDSTVYTYDEKGNPVEMVNYYIDYPIGKEQEDFLKDMGTGADTLIRRRKNFYNVKDQLIKTEWYEAGDLSFQTLRTYDSEGRLATEESKHFVLAEVNDYQASFQYNPSGKLIYQKVIFPNEDNRMEERHISYDPKGNKLKDVEQGKFGSTETDYLYDGNGRLIEIRKVVTEIFGKRIIKTLYAYDAQGRLAELKEYNGEELHKWSRYRYNEKGLKSEEDRMNVRTRGEVAGTVLYEYLFFE